MSRTLGMTRARLMNEISYRELLEQAAFDRIEPQPDSWLQTGILASLIYNALGGKPAKTPAEFIPTRRPPQEPQTVEEMIAIFDQITIGLQSQFAE